MLFLCLEVDTLYGAMEEGSNHIYKNSFCELKQIYYSEKEMQIYFKSRHTVFEKKWHAIATFINFFNLGILCCDSVVPIGILTLYLCLQHNNALFTIIALR